MKGLQLFALAIVLVDVGIVRADFVFDTLGNPSPAFSPGDIISVFDLSSAQSGQPAPFDAGIGSDPVQNFSAAWTHTFGPLQTVLAASISFGIYDNDSATAGDQLASFSVGGVDLFTLLNPLFEAVSPGNGQNSQYNVYTVNLPATVFPVLATGSVGVTLALQGPTFNPGIPGITPDTTLDFNGAALLYSRLEIEATAIPEPSSLTYLATGAGTLLGLFGWRRRRQAR